MMFKVLKKEQLSDNLILFEVDAKDIAKKAMPGNFIILKTHEEGERIPLTIADFDRDSGTITLVFQLVGKTTYHLGTFKEGDFIPDIIGPLGVATHIDNYGTVICVGGGVGIAPIYPITKALKEAGNKVVSIIGARTKSLLFWEEKMRAVSDELIVTTDDGSYGKKALVTVPLEEILKEDKDIKLAVTIGPAIMMKFVCMVTKNYGIKTVASLNSIMIDGTGMCGGCRVEIGGQTKFCCIDGPEFDGHEIDFDTLMARQGMYSEEEKLAFDEYMEKMGGK
jgi:ferredoxin--NADP+ reductase